jgi:hypothetical protein
VNSTVATSAIPIGMPGWPDLAFSTASAARKRTAFAMSRGATVVMIGAAAVIGTISPWKCDVERKG